MTDRGAAAARLIPFFGEDTPIGEITTKRINEFRTAALLGDERIGRGRPLKRTTVSRDMTNLSAIFKRALEEGWIATNPYLTAKKVKQKPAKSRDYNALTVPELEVVVRAARAEPEAALYRVAALTGLRFGELRSLRWRDIEWTAANLHVRKKLPVHATEEKEPKSEEGRSVPMFDQGRPRVRATLTPRLSGRARRSRVRERDRGPPRLRAHQGRVLRRARGCGLRPPAREGPEA
jgi:integrase